MLKINEYTEWSENTARDLMIEGKRLSDLHGDRAPRHMAIHLADTLIGPFYDPDLPVRFFFANHIFRILCLPENTDINMASRLLTRTIINE